MKWIYGEQLASYSEEVFIEKQRELNILPMKFKFIYNDIVLFYKIVNRLVPISLPLYISACIPDDVRYTRQTAPIYDRSDFSTFQCSVTPNYDAFKYSFFYRTMQRWNSLPVCVIQAASLTTLKSSLTNFLWSSDTDWPD